jgi:hypothetical protein
MRGSENEIGRNRKNTGRMRIGLKKEGRKQSESGQNIWKREIKAVKQTINDKYKSNTWLRRRLLCVSIAYQTTMKYSKTIITDKKGVKWSEME